MLAVQTFTFPMKTLSLFSCTATEALPLLAKLERETKERSIKSRCVQFCVSVALMADERQREREKKILEVLFWFLTTPTTPSSSLSPVGFCTPPEYITAPTTYLYIFSPPFFPFLLYSLFLSLSLILYTIYNTFFKQKLIVIRIMIFR